MSFGRQKNTPHPSRFKMRNNLLCYITSVFMKRNIREHAMATITFDPHEFIKRLKSVGFSEEQAEVFATGHRRITEDN